MHYLVTAPDQPDAVVERRDEMEVRAMIRDSRLVKDLSTVKVKAIYPPTLAFDVLNVKPWMGGYCWTYRFDNGYGASVVLHEHSYGADEGLYELLLAKFSSKGVTWAKPDDAMIENIVASEPGGDSSGLFGWLDSTEVTRILGAIRGYTPTWMLNQEV